MSDLTNNKTPDEAVADKIITRFVEAGLISNQDKKRTREQLTNGRLKTEDWRLLAEKALAKEVRGEADEG